MKAWNLNCNIKGRTQAEGFWEQDAAEESLGPKKEKGTEG